MFLDLLILSVASLVILIFAPKVNGRFDADMARVPGLIDHTKIN